MKIPAHIIQHGPVAPIDFDLLLKWSDSVQASAIGQEIFRGRGTIPEDWCLVVMLKDDSKYVVDPKTELSRADLARIASFHWLRPDLVEKLPRWVSRKSFESERTKNEDADPRKRSTTKSGQRLSKQERKRMVREELRRREESEFEDLSWRRKPDGSVVITDCDKSATWINIPSRIRGRQVTEIGDSAFEGCDSLVGVSIPHQVTRIGAMAFDNCSKLRTVSIPCGIKEIGYFVFAGCRSLTSIEIPASVEKIGVSAFSCCINLREVTMHSNVADIAEDAFFQCPWQPNTFGRGDALPMHSPPAFDDPPPPVFEQREYSEPSPTRVSRRSYRESHAHREIRYRDNSSRKPYLIWGLAASVLIAGLGYAAYQFFSGLDAAMVWKIRVFAGSSFLLPLGLIINSRENIPEDPLGVYRGVAIFSLILAIFIFCLALCLAWLMATKIGPSVMGPETWPKNLYDAADIFGHACIYGGVFNVVAALVVLFFPPMVDS